MHDVDDPHAGLFAAGWAAYRDGSAEMGAACATRILDQRADHGLAWWLLAICLERIGRTGEADRCFRRAAITAYQPQPPPYRVPMRRFQAVVDRATEDLAPPLRAALGEVALVLADYAEPDLLEAVDEPELLGLFTGSPRADRSPADGAMDITPTIHLFRRAHEHACSDADTFAAEVRRTLYHEFGHYLGYDEDDLERMGMD